MKNQKLTLLMAMLALVSTGCQKEREFQCSMNELNVNEENSVEVYYRVDDESFSQNLNWNADFDFFMQQMFALAKEGHTVSIRKVPSDQTFVPRKEIVTYTTDDERDAQNWTKNKIREGYSVDITYDSKTGIYTCTAIK